MVYVIVLGAVLIGFCALAVDLSRAQTAKTELRRVADAAARAGAVNLSNGDAAVLNAAATVAAQNLVDGSSVTLNTATDVQFINWVGPGNYTVVSHASSANAVRVYTRRTSATGNPIPMLFASVLGKSTLDVWASSIAQRVVVSSTSSPSSQYVPATSNPWLAGAPKNTQASKPDQNYPGGSHQWQYDIAGAVGGHAYSGEPYGSPVQAQINVQPGDILEITHVTGTAQNDPNGTTFNASGNQTNGNGQAIYDDDASHQDAPGPSGYYGPPINNSHTGQTEHYISDVYAPINSLVGVFLNDNQPSTGNAPTEILNFSGNGSNPATSSSYVSITNFNYQGTQYTVTTVSQDYSTASPKIQQSFYVGDGQTSGGAQQQIIVPAGATRLFLGTMDGHEWSNNVGGYNVTITEYQISIVQ